MTLGIEVKVDAGPANAKAKIEVFNKAEDGEDTLQQTVVVDQEKTSERIYLHSGNLVKVSEVIEEE